MPGLDYLLVHIAGAAVDIGLAFALLWAWRRVGASEPRRIGLVALAVVAAAVGVVAVLRLALLVILGQINLFGVIGVAYVALVVSAPIVGIGVALAGRTRVTPLARAAGATGVLAMVVGAYASFVEPWWLAIERAEVAIDPARTGTDPIRVVVLADVQTCTVRTGWHERVLREVEALKPDLVLLPGDLAQAPSSLGDIEPGWLAPEADAFRRFLARLDDAATGGAWMCQGNAEEGYDAWGLLEGTGVEYLVNDLDGVDIGDRRIVIAGVEWELRTPEAAAFLEGIQRVDDPLPIVLLMSHTPDGVLRLRRDSRVDLVVSGHTHGGQVVVPGFGPPLTFARTPRRIGAGGLHEHDGNAVYVSRGLGYERGQAPPVRIFCRPELTVIELR